MLIKHFEIGQDGSCPKLKDKEILKILSEMRDEDGGLYHRVLAKDWSTFARKILVIATACCRHCG
jgi:hypothetical protein